MTTAAVEIVAQGPVCDPAVFCRSQRQNQQAAAFDGERCAPTLASAILERRTNSKTAVSTQTQEGALLIMGCGPVHEAEGLGRRAARD